MEGASCHRERKKLELRGTAWENAQEEAQCIDLAIQDAEVEERILVDQVHGVGEKLKDEFGDFGEVALLRKAAEYAASVNIVLLHVESKVFWGPQLVQLWLGSDRIAIEDEYEDADEEDEEN